MVMNDVSQTGYGVDVSVKRADELEKRLLSVVQPGDSVLDLGCGAGGAAARLVAAEGIVTGVDIHDYIDDWKKIDREFVAGDIRQLETLLSERQFDYCLCNRTIHYLTYEEAAQLLRDLRRMVLQQLFISFSGMTSELVHGYAAQQAPIESRFDKLSTDAQETFGISQPLTLYSEAEAVKLLADAGWTVTWSRTTDFGNVILQAQS